MIDLILVLVIALLLAYIAWDRYATRQERETMIRAIIAKNASEMRDMQAVDKLQVKAQIKQEDPDLVDTTNMTDTEFDTMIKQQAGK
jgi:Tfp pilus assembly protein PilE